MQIDSFRENQWSINLAATLQVGALEVSDENAEDIRQTAVNCNRRCR
jgi:hypothetical protein